MSCTWLPGRTGFWQLPDRLYPRKHWSCWCSCVDDDDTLPIAWWHTQCLLHHLSVHDLVHSALFKVLQLHLFRREQLFSCQLQRNLFRSLFLPPKRPTVVPLGCARIGLLLRLAPSRDVEAEGSIHCLNQMVDFLGLLAKVVTMVQISVNEAAQDLQSGTTSGWLIFLCGLVILWTFHLG